MEQRADQAQKHHQALNFYVFYQRALRDVALPY